MRTFEEIETDISNIKDKLDALRNELNNLLKERTEFIFQHFCVMNGVTKGDIVETLDGEKLQIVGMDNKFDNWITCRKIKKDGKPYQSNVSIPIGVFNACKVIENLPV